MSLRFTVWKMGCVQTPPNWCKTTKTKMSTQVLTGAPELDASLDILSSSRNRDGKSFSEIRQTSLRDFENINGFTKEDSQIYKGDHRTNLVKMAQRLLPHQLSTHYPSSLYCTENISKVSRVTNMENSTKLHHRTMDFTWCFRSISNPKRNSIFEASSTRKEQG